MKYLSSKTVTQILGVTAQTLRNWDREGKLKPSYVKSNGYRYYSEEAILAYTQERKTKKNMKAVAYARCNDNLEKLDNEIALLEHNLQDRELEYEVIKDVGSGMDYNRPGLKRLIEMINRKEVDLIVTSSKDRLCRAGVEMLIYFAELNNVKIEFINKGEPEDSELVSDMLEVLEGFNMRLHGNNRGRYKEILASTAKRINKVILNNSEE